MKKIISLLLTAVLIITVFAGCGKSEKKINLMYPFTANVNSYDPQVASTGDEYLIIENTFEGLIRIGSDGKVKKGVADSWSISDDGLTYTFNLKRGMKWNIDTEKDDKGEYKDERLQMLGKEFNPDITANDFVFALQRAASKDTNCPLFSTISCIKNASAIHSGKKGVSTLGATAPDTYTLKIQLEKADKSFMETLTTAVAMPCNEEFFNATDGRYGLDTKYTLFNGQFYLDQILASSYLLRNNKFYKGDYPAKANQLALKILTDENKDKTVENLKSGYYDAAFIDGEDSDSIKDSSGITYEPYVDTTWAFILNTNNELLQSKFMRKAFCQGFTILKDTKKDYLAAATNLTPPSCTIGGNNAIKAMGSTVIKQDISKSVENWNKAINILDSTNVELTIITTDYMKNYAKQMLKGIQQGIGTSLKNSNGDTINFTLKVESMTDDELKSKVSSGDYDIAFYPFTSDSMSAVSYLQSIADDNPMNCDTTDVEKYLKQANYAGNIKDSSVSIKNAEDALLLTYSICPMMYETSYYACAKGVKNVEFHPGTGRVNFVNATREK